MSVRKHFSFLIYFISAVLLFSGPLMADELGSFGDRIFQFQEKLAKRGNVLAQYKLGTLYEFGVSVPANVKQATIWYKKAAEKDYTPAINRLTYLEIVQTGFDEQKHGEWFQQLESLADSADANALILLGQMHHHGTYVEKDLYSALDMLSQASSLGHTEVDSEIEAIKREIDDINQLKTIKKEAKPEKKQPAKKKPATKPTKQSKPKPAKPVKKQESEAEKRKRYEEAMRRIQQEARLLQEQQQWAEEN